MRVWTGHKIRGDRITLAFGHLATETSGNIDVESAVDDDGRGYVMPRAGWVVSVTTRLDVDSISGGDATIALTATPGGGVSQNTFFDSAGTLQIIVAAPSVPFRFAAQARLSVQMLLSTTISVSDLVVSVEVELER